MHKILRPRAFNAAVKAFAVAVIAVQPLSGCKRNAASQKSFVALNARVAAGDAPSFDAVAQWFQAAVDAGGDPGAEAMSSAPDELRSGLIAYVQQQVARTGEFQRKFGDKAALADLLDRETKEMMDIVLGLVKPEYQPATDDLFARLIVQPGIRDYVDAASAPALQKIFQRPLNEIYNDIEVERTNYLNALKRQYVNGATGSEQLGRDLARNCASLMAFLSKMSASPDSGTCSTGTARAGEGLTGGAPRFLMLFAGLNRAKALNEAARREDPVPTPTPQPQQPAQQVSPHAPRLSMLNGKIPSSPGGGGLGGLNSATCPRGFVERNGGCEPASDSGNYSLDDNWYNGGGNGGWFNLTAAGRAQQLPRLGKPGVDCVGLGYSGMQLVNCQRYYAYLPKFSDMRTKTSRRDERGTDLHLDGPSSGGSNQSSTDLLVYRAMPVQNQGSEGACTAFGFTHTTIANMQKSKKGYTFDSWQLWNRYGQPYMHLAAQAAQQGPLGEASVRSIRELRSLNEMIAVLDQGRAIWAASQVDGSWHSAGRGGGAVLTCSGPGGGHAYSLQGYVRDNSAPGGGYFVVKNSWGRTWGEDGYGYQPFACAAGYDAEAHDIDLGTN